MKINFVTEPEGNKWILRRWCEEWSKRIPDSTISTEASSDTDVNIFCNYFLFATKEANWIQKNISIFTHREKNDRTMQLLFDQAARLSDWCIAQSVNTAKLLPKEKTTVIHPGIGELFYRNSPITIGIVGREYNSGRKNFDRIDVLKSKFKELNFVHESSKSYEEMPDFYNKKIDYLLITANNEGGPMPVAEAIASGKPVIAPEGVGWCDEFSCIRYDGTLDDLIRVIKGLIFPRNQWEIGAKQIVQICERLMNEKNK